VEKRPVWRRLPGYPVVTQAARSKPGKLPPTSQKSTTDTWYPAGSRYYKSDAFSLQPLEGDNCPEIARGAKDDIMTKQVHPMANIYGTS
jgi:hypothetical protein